MWCWLSSLLRPQAQEDLPPELLSDDEEEEVVPGYEEKEEFIGLGLDEEEVPLYYRYQGTLPCRKILKGPCEKLIKQFWKFKRLANKALQKETRKPDVFTPLDDSFYEWLVKREVSNWQPGKKVALDLSVSTSKSIVTSVSV